MKKKYWLDYMLLIGLAGVIISLDQWTKWLVRTNLAPNQMWAPFQWLLPYARIVYWHNTGIAFGLFQSLGPVFAVLSVIVSLGILYYYPQVPANDWLIRIVMGILLGGAVGNLIDRLVQGFVTDYISLGTFPVFNVADGSISIGVAVLILGMWIREGKQKPVEADAIAEEVKEGQEPTASEDDPNG